MYKVLLVDDESEILNDHSRYIERLGFKCYTAQNGREALQILKQEQIAAIPACPEEET